MTLQYFVTASDTGNRIPIEVDKSTPADLAATKESWQTDWTAKPPREVWRRPVGAGWSGIAVAGRRAVTQEQHGELECLTCYDAATGEPESSMEMGGYAGTAPILANGTVFFGTASGDFFAYLGTVGDPGGQP